MQKLKEVSDQIDDTLVAALMDQSVEYKELVALLAHRFGALLSHAEEKRKLWKICEKIMREQAGIRSKIT